MLRSGIDIAVIALWMGHESTRTTMIYLKADLELKQRALDRTVPTDGEPGRTARPTTSSTSSTASDYPGPVTETRPAPGRTEGHRDNRGTGIGSGTSPPRNSPRPLRSSTCSTPASTSTTWPASWNSCSATGNRTGSPPAWKTSTTATSTASARPPASTPSWASRKTNWTRPWATSRTTRPGCVTPSFRSRGLFVGSGAVESGCKAVIGQRLETVRHALDRRRCQRHRHAPLPASQPIRRPDLVRTALPDTSRLTSRTRQTNLVTVPSGFHRGRSYVPDADPGGLGSLTSQNSRWLPVCRK